MTTRNKKKGTAKREGGYAPPAVRVLFALSFNYSVGDYIFASYDEIGDDAYEFMQNSGYSQRPEEIFFAQWPCGNMEGLLISNANAVADALEKAVQNPGKTIRVNGGLYDFEFTNKSHEDSDEEEDEVFNLEGRRSDADVTPAVVKRIILILRAVGRSALPKTVMDRLTRQAKAELKALKTARIAKKRTSRK